MFPCPHCGRTIDLKGYPPEPIWPPTPRYTVSLGCGSLILIALIVMIFSNRGPSQESIERLNRTINRLEQKVEDLQNDIERLERRLPNARAA